MCSSKPPRPDPFIGQAARQQADIAQQQLDAARQQQLLLEQLDANLKHEA